VVGVVDSRRVVGGGQAVVRVAHRLAGHQVAVLAAGDVVLAQHVAEDEVVAGQSDGGVGLAVAAVHRSDVVGGGVLADRQGIARGGIRAVTGQDGVVAGQRDAHARATAGNGGGVVGNGVAAVGMAGERVTGDKVPLMVARRKDHVVAG